MMLYVKMWWLCAVVVVHSTVLAMGNEPKILIIGAGPSGIAAASKLYEYAFQNITILEAENRIGGRVHTVWFDQHWIDLGGQWVHGETNNVVFGLASPLGLLEVPQETEYPIVYNSEGSQIPISTSDKLHQLFSDITFNATEDLKGNNGSVGDYFTKMLMAEAPKYPQVNQTLMEQFIHLFEGYQNAGDASDNWYNTSARGQIEYWTCPGSSEVIWKDKGYATILDILMKKYPNPEDEFPVLNNTILNSEVININYNSTAGKVLVELTNGDEYVADHVIVTPSLGVLKEQYETLFTPELPEHKVKAIKGLEIGTVGKLFVFFEEAWWPDNVEGFSFLWTESDRQEYESDPHKKWLLNITGFFTLTHKPRILYGWINGAGARYMETLPENQVLNETLAILNKFIGSSYNITRPTGFLRTIWYSNKHFRGTYSYRSMESERADVWAEELAAPLLVSGKPTVMFAGEATHSHHFSTVHGAIESGFREADRLITMYNKSIPA